MINKSLREVLDKMKYLSDKGYDTYFKGQGNGTVKLFAEGIFIVDIVNKNKKKIKNRLLSISKS